MPSLTRSAVGSPVGSGLVDRASAEDVVTLATDVGSAPMQVGALLVLEGPELDPEQLAQAVARRVRTVPRLRQRLVRTPPGCGRPVWVDDPGFDVAAHVSAMSCPAPGDEAALLSLAARVVGTRLPEDRPLWRMVQVRGLAGDGSALIVAFHHVLADGIGGLAVLANLVDGGPEEPAVGFPRPSPSRAHLALDAARGRLAALRHIGRCWDLVRSIGPELAATSRTRTTRCSLNRPTGPYRDLAVVRADLEQVREVAHQHAATVNDVVLAAISTALGDLLGSRGEHVDEFVISVPVAARRTASAGELGNQVGVVPISVPATGAPAGRISAVAARTRVAKLRAGTSATAMLGPVFRLLALAGCFQWFIDRQRLVHTFATNLVGPPSQLRLMGRAIAGIAAVAMVTGNVTVSFAVLSYAGTLTVTIIADPGTCPDLAVLRSALQAELDRLCAPTPQPATVGDATFRVGRS